MDKLEKFKNLQYDILNKSLAWRIYGKGMENFGDNKKPTEIPLSEPEDDEILVRTDAVSLCFSDTKLIKFGNNHPRIHGRNLRENPVIPGHEVALTVIKAGKNRKTDYKPGDRFILQADVYYKGKGTAYGYILPGGLSQYGIISKEILDGDEGSYLIPIHKKDIGYSEIALVEPWACVVASYRIKHRNSIKRDGNLLLIGNGRDEKDWNLKGLFKEDNLPKQIISVNISKVVKQKLKNLTSDKQIRIFEESDIDIKDLSKRYTDGKGFDDIIIFGDIKTNILNSACDNLYPYGILNYLATTKNHQIANIDAGKIHYDRISFIGSLDTDVEKPYTENLDYSLKGNAVILFGAGGPMGQMHVQLVMESNNPPKTVVATDIAQNRIDALKNNFDSLARDKGIDFHVINPKNFTDQNEYKKELFKINNNNPYDYVICLAAIPQVIEDAASYLKKMSILNIFAGVSKGTVVKLNIKDVVDKSVRFIGSSGSSIADMEYTLRKLEKGELNTDNAVAGISGMNDVWKGLDAVSKGTYPGKIVVYPHIKHLDLISLKVLNEKYPKIGKKLSKSGKWHKEAEAELLKEMLDI